MSLGLTQLAGLASICLHCLSEIMVQESAPKVLKKQQQNKMLVSVKHIKSVNYLPWNSKRQ